MHRLVLKPAPPIEFRMIDVRLKKYGLQVVDNEDNVTLVGPCHSLIARADGEYAYFERKLGEKDASIIDAILLEYGSELVDHEDCRYHRDGETAGKEGEWIVFHGEEPAHSVKWLNAVKAAEECLHKSQARHTLLRETDGVFDLSDVSELEDCALSLITRSPRARDLGHFVYRDMVLVMVQIGLLRQVGEHYRLTIPDDIDTEELATALCDLYESTVPEAAMKTVSRRDAKVLERRLMDGEVTSDGLLYDRNVIPLSPYREPSDR